MASEVRVPRLLTVRELADATGVSAWRWYELFNERTGPPFVKIGNTYRVREDKFVAWLEAQEAKVSE